MSGSLIGATLCPYKNSPVWRQCGWHGVRYGFGINLIARVVSTHHKKKIQTDKQNEIYIKVPLLHIKKHQKRDYKKGETERREKSRDGSGGQYARRSVCS